MTDMPKTVSLDDIETAQQSDPLLPQDDEHYTVINGIVHRKTQHGYPLPYIPPGLRVRLLNLHHDTINGAHFAADRMYEALKRVCYWTNMMDDCTWWCDSCGTCQRNKPPRVRPQPLRSRVGSYPHELVFADYLFLDHIPILVLTDAFSKYLTMLMVGSTLPGFLLLTEEELVIVKGKYIYLISILLIGDIAHYSALRYPP
ncbi:hypothetical protein FOZ60_006655 [Perkinsus olseni]|uniref:Integrase zinc-binding domain-containing protein n=1 Tax=Perkinsus olseni TaxID=32597 RepID=A0A7J6NPA2_PEROL|nr:hypothetical protein FOZ60_006655 [Perkinsus olseni]